jgi:hypothetical protein
MANTNAPFGLAPVQYLNGSPFNGKGRRYYIPSGDTNKYAIGDPVITSTGAADSMGVQAVTLATAGDSHPVLGVIVGFGSSVYGGPGVDTNSQFAGAVIPATKTHDYYVYVVDDPNVLFEIQEYGSSYTVADVGKNCNLKSGTDNGYVSGWVLDDSAVSATNSTRQLRLVGLVQRRDNAPGAYARWLVLINLHQYKAGVAGI